VSILSAGCLFWLEALQPLFAAIAVGSLGFQGWLVWRRPAYRRTRRVMAILWSSVATSALVLVVWVGLWWRYQ